MEIGVLAPVEEPTEWVSQMAVVKKPDGSLRICIDPQTLNEALQREHYKLPTFNDVLPTLRISRRSGQYNMQRHHPSITSQMERRGPQWRLPKR